MLAQLDEAHKGLLKAAELIEDRGWWNGRHKRDDKLCLGFALQEAGGYNLDLTKELYTLVYERIGDQEVSQWNDSHTEQEVLDLLRDLAYS